MLALDALKRYWPTVDESGAYTGPFSTLAEYHSAAIGLGAAATCFQPAMLAVAGYAGLLGINRHRKSGHYRDVAKEPAYALGAMAIGRFVFCELGPVL